MIDPASGLGRFLAERDALASGGPAPDAGHRLAGFLTEAVAELAGDPPPGIAVVATGGFGRGIMSVHSDVDLLFLHTGGGEAEMAKRVLRPLWDAHLKVGHLSHTPKDARVFAGTRLDAISTFLTARLITGEIEVFEDFRRRFSRLLDKEHARIVEMMAAEERRRRDQEPYRLMGADLKNGRGGVRTLDLIDWRRRLMEAQSVNAGSAGEEETRARLDLMEIRSALHAVTGRLHDVYDFEIRQPAARWLGTDVVALGRRIMAARSSAEALVDADWPQITTPRPQTGSRTGFIGRTKKAARGDIVSWWRSGVLDDLPEVRRLLDEPHVVPFHRYAVADHVAAAVDRAWDLVDGTLDDPIAREVLTDLPGPELAVWAALVHDIGKGLEGDHSRVGARAVPAIARRMGLPPEDADVLRRLVEHHLLLADLATKYDSDDPAVLAWAADRIVDNRTLRFLYLLTVADSQATGSDTWSPWRAELCRRAFRRVEREIVRRSIPEEMRVAVLADRVLDVAEDGLGRDEVIAHLAGLSEIYRSSHSPEVIRDHILMARQPLGPGGGTVAVFEAVPSRIVVMAKDRPGLLLDVAGVMALERFSIIDARFATRADGRVFDTFEVVDAGGSREIDRARLDRLVEELRRALRGGLDIAGSVAVKQRAYRDTARKGVEPVVSVARSDDGGGTVEVECADRLGLLRDIGAVFDHFGMPVLRARIDTRGGVAYDVFQVARVPADVAGLESALARAVS